MIPVLMADDETLIRTALATMLDLEEDLEVVAHVDTGEELLASWRRRTEEEAPVAVAVLDLQMPGRDGIDVGLDLLELTPGAAVLIVTSHGRPAHLKRGRSQPVNAPPAYSVRSSCRRCHVCGSETQRCRPRILEG